MATLMNNQSGEMNALPFAPLVLLGIVLSVLTFLTSRYWRLRHIPGPFAASLTDFWAAIRIWRDEYPHIFLQDLHARYGPVVRWGPSRVSFASPTTIPSIYGTQNVYPKAPSYSPLTVLSQGEEVLTLVTIRDEKRLTEMKRHVSAGFSQSTWLKQEGEIDSSLQSLRARLESEAGKDVDLRHWIRLWGVDILTLLAFGESRQYLSHGSDIDGIFPASKERFTHWRTWSAVPTLERILFKNPLLYYLKTKPGALARLALQQISARRTGDKQAAGHDLLGRYLAASQQAPDVIRPKDVLALTISTINAGTDTVSLQTTSTLAYLLANPELLAKLEKELLAANLAIPASFKDLDKLPFLDAVIRENLRLAINPNTTERTINNSQGVHIYDTYIPQGTDVSVAQVLVARDPSVFGEKSDLFVPQRWLDADEKTIQEMKKASFHFSFGRRECIGKHLAMIELKKCVAMMVASFKMELVEEPERGFDAGVGYCKLKAKLRARSPVAV